MASGDFNERRLSKPTEKGLDYFKDSCDSYKKKLSDLTSHIDTLVNVSPLDISTFSSQQKQDVCDKLSDFFDQYKCASDDYLNFLSRHNTEESAIEQSLHSGICRTYAERVAQLKAVLSEVHSSGGSDCGSRKSGSKSCRSSRSSASVSTFVEKKMKAEAAKARLKFVKREVELQHSAAAIQANMAELAAYKEVAVAEAELSVVQDEISDDRTVSEVSQAKITVPKHTAPFLPSMSNVPVRSGDPALLLASQTVPMHVSTPASQLHVPVSSSYQGQRSTPTGEVAAAIIGRTQAISAPPLDQQHNSLPASPSATVGQGLYCPPVVSMSDEPQPVLSDFARLLLKKDLVTTIDNFDDKPEHFASWKAGFLRMVQELAVTSSEELDLLVKWLGPDSAGEARSIRSSYGFDPAAGCRAIWTRLDERYGAPEQVEASVKRKLQALGNIGIQNPTALYKLSDILGEIEALKSNPQYQNLLAYYDSSSGVSPIVSKLPYGIQEKWITRAFQYKQRTHSSYPPFSFFVSFIREMSSMRNDPSLVHEQTQSRAPRQHVTHEQSYSRAPRHQPTQQNRNLVSTRKTDVSVPEGENTSNTVDDLERTCPIHKTNHSLNECIRFKKMPLDKRREYLRINRICYRCCISKDHQSRSCSTWKPCSVCQSTRHPSALHLQGRENQSVAPETQTGTAPEHGGEGPAVSSMCTRLCGSVSGGRSCSKVVFVQVYPSGCPQDAIHVYAILDDQSNHTLARPELLDHLGVNSPRVPYSLSSCAGVTETSGRMASGFTVAAMDGSLCHSLPVMVECDDIPNNSQEIPTPEVASAHPHLAHIACNLYPLQQVGIQLLIGRDLLEAHHVHEQIVGPRGTPFAQKLSLGWVVIGDVCLDGRHRPSEVTVMKTHVQPDGRGTIFEPCRSRLHIEVISPLYEQQDTCCDLFRITKDDEKIGTSVEDREFISLMDSTFSKNEEGEWTAPLPFKDASPNLPNNRVQTLRRANGLVASLQKNPNKLEHMLQFMEKIFRAGAAEPAPAIVDNRECWYLPIFGVYHPKKPDQVRGVFDSSVVYDGKSLNDALLTGPNLTNSLLGILLRFRKDQCAIAGDIQQMFYRFFVAPEHRDYLRFFWYDRNDPKLPLVEYRMKVHVFGNRPSPAVATYGLRRAVQNTDSDVRQFVERDFYVDDALTSRPAADQVVDLMKRTQGTLKDEGNIRLHKIVSNDHEVMKAFPAEDLGKDTKSLTFTDDSLLLQHSLGLQWDLKSDCFLFFVPQSDVAYTRRGVLSRISSIFDPMGFLSPLTICGKILLRQMCPAGTNWDDPLSDDFREAWMHWNQCAEDLRDPLRLPRMFVPSSWSTTEDPVILIFSDASETAIASSAYVLTGEDELGFIMGKAKLAPLTGHSIPRLELCGAVLATEIGTFVSDHLDIPLSTIRYYSDSKVVLGYIRNRKRRFYTYVSNRVAQIHKVSSPDQWSYVPTHLNPADQATRGSLQDVRDCLDLWLKGPTHLLKRNIQVGDSNEDFPLVAPDHDPDVRPEVVVKKSDISLGFTPFLDRFERFSTWKSLTSAFSVLSRAVAKQSKSMDLSTLELPKAVEEFIIRHVQQQSYSRECAALGSGKEPPRDSSIRSLSPYLDDAGLLRVGGRLNNLRESLGLASVNPVIIPKGHLALLFVRHFHEKTSHQGRTITEGMIRSNGYWIIGAKRLITSVIFDCVICRKLRRKPEEQKMADLPLDRLTPGPPFTSVGVDVFGPWTVVTRKTRGGAAHSKRWATLFTCLTTRAVHIELIEDMSSSCFINALRRLVALRGPVKRYRSDRGSNFVGAVGEIGVQTVNVEQGEVQSYLKENSATWIFNAPHSSHMGGVWERAIGIARRILDSMLLKEGQKELTHEVLSTLMCEVCAIMNSRPVAVLDSDPSDPLVLSPNILLTQKQGDTAVLSEGISMKDMYTAQWKHVQVLSDMFWKKWQTGYLNALQTRKKWSESRVNLKNGDLVLLRDKNCHRNNWCTAVVEETFPSGDGLVRKASVRMIRNGAVVRYTRPVSEMVLLLD